MTKLTTDILNPSDWTMAPDGVVFDPDDIVALVERVEPIFDAHPDLKMVLVDDNLEYTFVSCDENKEGEVLAELDGAEYREENIDDYEERWRSLGLRIYRDNGVYAVWYAKHSGDEFEVRFA